MIPIDLALKALMALGNVSFLMIVLYIGHLIIKYKSPFAWLHASTKEKNTVWILIGVFITYLLLILALAMINNRGLVVE